MQHFRKERRSCRATTSHSINPQAPPAILNAFDNYVFRSRPSTSGEHVQEQDHFKHQERDLPEHRPSSPDCTTNNESKFFEHQYSDAVQLIPVDAQHQQPIDTPPTMPPEDEDENTLPQVQPSTAAVVKLIKKGLKFAASWDKLLSFLCLHGNIRFSKSHYTVLQESVLSAADNEFSIHSYTTARTNQEEYFRANCFPDSKIVEIPHTITMPSLRSRESTITTDDNNISKSRNCIRLVLPSSWARFDLQSLATYSDVIAGRHHFINRSLSVEKSPFIEDRETVVGSAKTFWATYQGVTIPVNINTLVSIQICPSDSSLTSVRDWPLRKQSTGTFVDVRVGPQWCVSTPGYISPRSRASHLQELSSIEEPIFRLFQYSAVPIRSAHNQQSRKRPRYSRTAQKRVMVYPSDIITIIRPEHIHHSTNVIPLYISSLVSNITENSAERLVFIDCSDTDSNENKTILHHVQQPSSTTNTVDYIHEFSVSSSPTVHPKNNVPILQAYNRTSDTEENGHTGELKDGTKYVIYRFAFYADEFGTDGVCGCYLLLLGAAQHNRVSSAGVRVLTLVPKHQDTNHVLNLILEDVVQGSTHGIDSIDPFGRKIKIFLDMCSAFGDYVKMSAITNTAGHSATCFCTLCKVQRNRSVGPTYAYSADAHSRRLGFMRCDERNDVLLKLELPKEAQKLLGLKTCVESIASNIPLVRFANSMAIARSEKQGHVNMENKDVVPIFFDSMLSTAVAPDHLITGLISILLHACFQSIENKDALQRLESQILCAAAENGLPTDGKFLIFTGTRFSGIKSLTMSVLYVVLLMATPYFNNIQGTTVDSQGLLTIPQLLQDIVSLLYYWPVDKFDSAQSLELVHSNNRLNYYRQLKIRVEKYTTAVANHMYKFGDDALLKDKPNSHRLLELVVHTVPVYGHGKFLSELILELTHAFFKTWLKDNTHSNNHITAVDLFLCRAWSMNMFVAYNMWKNGSDRHKPIALACLQRLFFKLTADASIRNQEEVQELLQQFEQRLHDLLQPPIRRLLVGSTPLTFLCERSHWVLKGLLSVKGLTELTSTAVNYLANHRSQTYGHVKSNISFYGTACYTTKDTYSCGSRTYQYRSLFKDTVMAIYIEQDDIAKNVIDMTPTSAGSLLLCGVHDIVLFDNVIWIFGCVMSLHNESYTANTEDVKVIRLVEGVSRVATVHNCTTECESSPTQHFKHYPGMFNGGRYTLLSKRYGYPPNLG